MLSYSFPKQKRLLVAANFKTVLTKYNIKISNEALIVYALADTKPRLGLAIANKYVKKSVQRNSIKRVIRESFRLNYARLPNVAIVITARTALVKLNKKEVDSNIEIIWQQLRKKFPPAAVIL